MPRDKTDRSDGDNVGVVSPERALELSDEAGLDL